MLFLWWHLYHTRSSFTSTTTTNNNNDNINYCYDPCRLYCCNGGGLDGNGEMTRWYPAWEGCMDRSMLGAAIQQPPGGLPGNSYYSTTQHQYPPFEGCSNSMSYQMTEHHEALKSKLLPRPVLSTKELILILVGMNMSFLLVTNMWSVILFTEGFTLTVDETGRKVIGIIIERNE